jgi:hypothetical protein
MQTFKDLKALSKRLGKCNGLYSLKSNKDFLHDTFKLDNRVYDLFEYGYAQGDIDKRNYSYMMFTSDQKAIKIYYQLPVDNGISWERKPFKVIKIDVK